MNALLQRLVDGAVRGHAGESFALRVVQFAVDRHVADDAVDVALLVVLALQAVLDMDPVVLVVDLDAVDVPVRTSTR